MATLPSQVTDFPKVTIGQDWGRVESVRDYVLRVGGHELTHRGKAKDTYRSRGGSYNIVVTSDRISVLDFVLPVLIPGKGEILTAITHFWLTQILSGVKHHLILGILEEFNSALFKFLPINRCLTVEPHVISPFEFIYRRHPGGSVWNSYLETGTVAGQRLPDGLAKWDRLPEAVFTPSTKAEEGHDVNITVGEFEEQAGLEGIRIADKGAIVYEQAYEHAQRCGLLILDTKFEFSTTGILCDEVCTPDSSRFTTIEDWERAQREGRDPIFFDKEPVRVWARQIETPWGIGYQNLDPENAAHLAFVHSVPVPMELIHQTQMRYQRLFQMLVGQDLVSYQRAVMGIN